MSDQIKINLSLAWLRKVLGYDNNFQMFKSFAVDIGILLVLWFVGVEISHLELICPPATYQSNIVLNLTFNETNFSLPV